MIGSYIVSHPPAHHIPPLACRAACRDCCDCVRIGIHQTDFSLWLLKGEAVLGFQLASDFLVSRGRLVFHLGSTFLKALSTSTFETPLT